MLKVNYINKWIGFGFGVLIYLLMFVQGTSCAVISSITGGLASQEIITINGSAFGSKQNAAPIKWETFESYFDGDSIIAKGSVPQWINTGDESSWPKVVTTKTHSGKLAVFSDFDLPPGYDCSFTHARLEFPATIDLYATYWVYWDTSIGGDISTDDFFKLSRFNTDEEYSGTPALKPQLIPDYGIPEGTNGGRLEFQVLTSSTDEKKYFINSTSGTTHGLTHGSWHRLEFFVRLSNPAGSEGTGDYEFLIDGQPINSHLGWNQTDDITRVAGDDNKAYNIFLLELAGCRYSENARPLMWQDDIYVDNTRARVEIGDSKNWSDCTHREIQIPAIWGDGQIQITVNQGSMDTLADKYLFVVDAEGNVSPGFSLANVGGEVVRPMPPRDPKMN